MGNVKPTMTKSQQRLFNLFKSVEDEDIKDIMVEVIFLESQHRSGNFPRKKVADIVDAVAKLCESREKTGG